MDILFLAKHKPFADEAAQMVCSHFPSAKIIFGERNDPFPIEATAGKFDYIISYICPWIIPASVLASVRRAAINFHPGPLKYPGIGCTNFAIYDGQTQFGITVHHMAPSVDSGAIIAVEHFPILPRDDVYALTQRCYAHIYTAFVRIFDLIVQDKPLPSSSLQWARKPYTRRELNDLCVLTKAMPPEEIARRTRAVTYPGMPGVQYV